MTPSRACAAVDKHGALLVFPIDNAKEPASLWSVFFPRSQMRWEWDEEGDNRVADLWHLRARLAPSRKVVYTKWFKGRATFLSRELFTALLCVSRTDPRPLSRTARELLNILEDNSPLSTKALKKAADLRGRDNEGVYSRALKELWERFLIVGFGEVDDGAFPSLAVGSSRLLFEDLWKEAEQMTPQQADALVRERWKPGNRFLAFYEKKSASKSPKISS